MFQASRRRRIVAHGGVASPGMAAPTHGLSVEQFAKEALAATTMATLVAMLPSMIAMAATVIEHACAPSAGPLVASRARYDIAHIALDDLIEFAPVEPDPATLRAIVDLDALALTHDQVDPAGGTQETWRCTVFHYGKSFSLAQIEHNCAHPHIALIAGFLSNKSQIRVGPYAPT